MQSDHRHRHTEQSQPNRGETRKSEVPIVLGPEKHQDRQGSDRVLEPSPPHLKEQECQGRKPQEIQTTHRNLGRRAAIGARLGTINPSLREHLEKHCQSSRVQGRMGNVWMCHGEEEAGILPLLHRLGRLQVQAQRTNDLGGETSSLGKAAPQLRQIHGFDGAEILHPIDVVQPKRNDGQ